MAVNNIAEKPCRIPTFRSRIPPHQNHQFAEIKPEEEVKEKLSIIDHHHHQNRITEEQVGNSVLIGNRQGILKYVGLVNFSKGIWCGIELINAVGKNNGTVNGVRYFSCAEDRGLMAPISKVALIEDGCSSGPHSILCLDNDFEDAIITVVPSSEKRASFELGDLRRLVLTGTVPANKTTILKNDDAKTSKNATLNLTLPNDYEDFTAADELSLRKTRSVPNSPDEPTSSIIIGQSSKKRTNNGTFTKNNATFSTSSAASGIINHSCENLLFDAKRRKTTSRKYFAYLTQLELEKRYSSPIIIENNKLEGSPSEPWNFASNNQRKTELMIDFQQQQQHHQQIINNNNEHDDESIGILTPDQMEDYTTHSLDFGFLTPSREENFQLCDDLKASVMAKNEAQSPNLNSVTADFSFGIIDLDQMHSGFTMLQTDDNNTTNVNLDLPLDPLSSSVLNASKFALIRGEETPSPEELPLDTTPIIAELGGDSKAEILPKTINNKNNSCSIITSITSITSLDTGYQGDGEMSRPGSRGPDNSPLTRRPFSKPNHQRKPDTMTDSDFCTESDADNPHEENNVGTKGDRKAQVIDGTLYGVDPQAAADIYVNNRENMDSSGVFTDIENGLRNDDDIILDNNTINKPLNNNNNNITIDISPSESTKTISENSQISNLNDVMMLKSNTTSVEPNFINNDQQSINNKKIRSPYNSGLYNSNLTTTTSQIRRANNKLEDNNTSSTAKKYKMPKRDVGSKVKAMLNNLETGNNAEITSVNNKKPVKKIVNKWDAVMNKISSPTNNEKSFKEVNSKVFERTNNLAANIRKVDDDDNNKSPKTGNNNTKNRIRIRTRTPHSNIIAATSSNNKNVKRNVESSISSSLSDLSASTSLPSKNSLSASAKKRDTIQVTQVLTQSKLSSGKCSPLTSTNNNNKKSGSSVPSSVLGQNNGTNKFKRSPILPKKIIQKESTKSAVNGTNNSPSTRSNNNPENISNRQNSVKKFNSSSRTTEALAILVQHLVFNVEAFQVPHLKHQVKKYRLENEKNLEKCKNLEELLSDAKRNNILEIDQERVKYRKEITDLLEKHQEEILILTSQHESTVQQKNAEKAHLEKLLNQRHEEQFVILKKELEKVQKAHEESLDILREENDCIREQIDEERLRLEKVNHESLKLKNDYESKEVNLKEQLENVKLHREKLKNHITKIEQEYQEKIRLLLEENCRLKEDTERLLSYGDDNNKDVAKQEVQSLRVVLELKQNELTDLRKSHEETKQKQTLLEGAEEKCTVLQARCEDLQHQLQRKSEYEQTLIQENLKLQETLKDEINHSKRLSQHNEELQWKLKQNKEIVTKVIEQAEETVFNRSNIYSSSFNENYPSSGKPLERALSFRESSSCSSSLLNNSSMMMMIKNTGKKSSSMMLEYDEDDDGSPPTSPKVKGVVRKSDSVSYVLDLDESPDIVAQRILRRSFRNSITPPKATTTTTTTNSAKSPSTKRPRIRNSSGSQKTDSKDDVEDFLWLNDDDDNKLSRINRGNNNNNKVGDFYDGQEEEEEENDEDLHHLPALPNEMDKRNGILTLPPPARVATVLGDGAAAFSDSNSEDESTSSSQL